MAPRVKLPPVTELQKMSAEALERLLKSFDAVWSKEAKAPGEAYEGLRSVLHDASYEGGTGGVGVREFGKNSLAVKKDLLHKSNLDVAPSVPDQYGYDRGSESDAWVANSEIKERNMQQRVGYGIAGPNQDYVHPIELTREPEVPNMRSRSQDPLSLTESPRYEKHDVVAGPRMDQLEGGGTHPGDWFTWQNLMKDPQFPKVAATAGAGAALLGASNASAATKAPRFDEIEGEVESTPAAPRFADIQDASSGAPPPSVVAPMGTSSSTNQEELIKSGALPKKSTKPLALPETGRAHETWGDLGRNVAETLGIKGGGVLGDIARGATPTGALGILEERVLDPYVVTPLQEKVGTPLLNVTIKAQRDLVGKSEGEEYIQRIISIPIAGRPQAEHFAATSGGLKAVNELERQLGVGGLAFASGLAEQLGNVPLFILNPIAGTLATPEMSVSKPGSLMKGEIDLETMLLGGGALMKGVPALAGWAAKGISSVIQKGKSLLVMNKEGLTDLADSLAQVPRNNAPSVIPSKGATTSGVGGGTRIEPIRLTKLTEEKLAQRTEAAKTLGKGNKEFAPEAPTKKKPVSPEAETTYTGPKRNPTIDDDLPPTSKTSQSLFDVLSSNPKMVPAFNIVSAKELKSPILADIVEGPTSPVGVIYDAVDNKLGQYFRELREIADVRKFASEVQTYASHSSQTLTSRDLFQKMPPSWVEAYTLAGREATPKKPKVFAHVEPGQHKPSWPAAEGRTNAIRAASSTASVDPKELTGKISPDLTRVTRATPDADLPPGVMGQSDVPIVALVDENGGFKVITPAEGTAKESITKIREGGSPPPPPPGAEPMPPAPPPGPPPPPEVGVDNIMAGIAKKASLYEQAKRQLVGAHLRAPLDIASYVSDQQSLKSLERQWAGTMVALEKAAGKQGTREVRNLVYHMFKGDADPKALEKLADGGNPVARESFIKLRDMVGNAIRKRDENQRWLAERGYVPDETFSQSEGELFNQYVAREYAQHMLPPEEWKKIIVKDGQVMKRAIEGFKKGKEGMTDVEAKVKILNALTSEDPWHALTKPGTPLAPGQHLRYRKDLPDWYRDLLGENRDGFLAVSRTLATQESLIQNFKIWEGLRDAGKVLDAPATINDRQLPDNRRQYGVAAGKFVSPELYDAMVTIPNIRYEGDKVVQAISSFVKTNQVSLGSFRTFMNMFMDNMMGGVLSGGVDLTRPATTYAAAKKAFKAIGEYAKNPLADTEFTRFISDARRIGVDAPGHIGGEQSNIMRRQAADAMLQISGEKSYPGMLTRMFEAHQRLGAKTGGALVDWIDRVHKLASWEIITNDLMKKAAKAGTPMTREAAMRQAARPIFESYPMYDRLAPLAERMRSGLVGIAAPYSTFAMERNRILGSIPGRLKAGDKGLAFRIFKYGGLMSGIYAVNGLRAVGDVAQEDVDAVMQRRKGSVSEQFSPPEGVWIATHRDGQGRPAVLDFTQWFAPLSYLQGDQELEGYKNIAINVFRAPLQGGMAGEMFDAAQQASGVNMGFQQRKPNPAYPWWVNLGDRAMRAGVTPRFITDTYDNVAKSGMVGNVPQTREALTPMQGALRTFPGIPFEQQPSGKGKDVNTQKQIKDATAILYKAVTMDPEEAKTPLEAIYDWSFGKDDPEIQRIRKKAGELLHKGLNELQKSSETNRRTKNQKEKR